MATPFGSASSRHGSSILAAMTTGVTRSPTTFRSVSALSAAPVTSSSSSVRETSKPESTEGMRLQQRNMR